MTTLEIRKLLVLSTGHLTKDTVDYLDRTDPAIWGFAGGHYGDAGYFCYAYDDAVGVPDDLLGVMRFARTHGCVNVLFDKDAEQIDNLPYYDW